MITMVVKLQNSLDSKISRQLAESEFIMIISVLPQ
jgi:hypothetical protein